jgi:hypothetical protein
MRIRMLVQMPPGARRNGQPWPSEGETEDIPTGEALHLVASGVAEEAERPVRRSKVKREGA